MALGNPSAVNAFNKAESDLAPTSPDRAALIRLNRDCVSGSSRLQIGANICFRYLSSRVLSFKPVARCRVAVRFDRFSQFESE